MSNISFRPLGKYTQFHSIHLANTHNLIPPVTHVKSTTHCQRINANGGAPNDLFSLKKKKQWLHNEYYESLLWGYPVFNGNNLLTLLAADPPPSRLELVLLNFFSCFLYLSWVPTDSFPHSRAGQFPHPPLSADQFQKALDPGNCPLLSPAHLLLSKYAQFQAA